MSDDEELARLEHAWLEAIQRNDFAALEQIVAPEYTYTASGQGRWSRERWMETVPVYDVHSYTFVDLDISVYSDVAVVFPHIHLTASVAGATRTGDFLITDVWVRRNESWQVVARSSILMPEAS